MALISYQMDTDGKYQNNKFSQHTINMQTIIDQSRGILSLEDNWDDNDAKAVSKDTWERMSRFVIWFDYFLERRKINLPITPNLSATSDGGIDLHFRNDSMDFLINVAGDINNGINFFWDDYDRSYWLKGGFKPNFEDKIKDNPTITIPL